MIPGQNVSAFVQDYTGTDTQVQRYLIELIHAQSSYDNLYHRCDETKLVRIAESAITCGTKLSTSTKA